MSAAEPAGEGPVNRYRVDVRQEADGWRVTILDPGGRPVSDRACRDEREAWTYASTVRQHAYWLSEETFRAYYRIGEPGRGLAGAADAGAAGAVERDGEG